jgi:elongation factor G
MEPDKKLQKVVAEVPMAEMFKYATDLRSITGARGSFEMKFERYEEVPASETLIIIDEVKRSRELRNEA